MRRLTFRETNRDLDDSVYRNSDYSIASIQCVRNTQTPFMNAHNICINSTLTWKIFLESGEFNIHYPANSSIISISFSFRF